MSMSAPHSTHEEQLRSCMKAFSAAPSFTNLRRLAELWEGEERWSLCAQAWLHVTNARPHDAQACAHAAVALSRLAQHELSTQLWARACRIQPDNREYAAAYARAIRESEQPQAQANVYLDRTEV